MKKGWSGGGNTKTWLFFEEKVDFLTLIGQVSSYSVVNHNEVFYSGQKVAEAYKKHEFYKKFLIPRWIDGRKILSALLLPDNAIYVLVNNKLFIVEVKNQWGGWSVDEKLQTCDFKKKQYEKLMRWTGVQVEFCYILNMWWMQERYRDVFNYIQAVGCKYFFEELPLEYLGLPTPDVSTK